MTRVWIPAIVIAVFGIVSTADATDISMGAKGGVNISNVRGDDIRSDEVDSRYGFIGGVFVDFRINEMFSIQPELVYSMKGITTEIDSSSGQGNWSANYVQLPVLFEIHIEEIPSVDFSLYAGPVIGVNMSSEVSVKEGDVEVTVDYKSVTSDYEFGVVAGTEVDIPAGPGFIVVDVRIDYGLTSFDDSYSTNTNDVYNRAVGIMAGYGFTF